MLSERQSAMTALYAIFLNPGSIIAAIVLPFVWLYSEFKGNKKQRITSGILALVFVPMTLMAGESYSRSYERDFVASRLYFIVENIEAGRTDLVVESVEQFRVDLREGKPFAAFAELKSNLTRHPQGSLMNKK